MAVEKRPGVDPVQVAGSIRRLLRQHVAYLAEAVVEIIPDAEDLASEPEGVSALSGRDILPPRYRDAEKTVSAAPMGAAALTYDDEGEVAWNEVWGGFCELALAGGAPHRGTLLEPVKDDAIDLEAEQYEKVLKEIERGIGQVTGLPVVRSETPGWIGMECRNEEMALWLLRAIVVENISVRREGAVLWFPAGPEFRLEREIKSIITVVAKTAHYWDEHVAGRRPDNDNRKRRTTRAAAVA